MGGSLVRIDDRLVHGQILEAWLPHLGTRFIAVIDEEIASDSFRRAIMALVVPPGVAIDIFPTGRFIAEHNSGLFLTRPNVLFLFSDTTTLVKAFQGGFVFSHLNIGNLCSANAIRVCSPSVMLNAEDMSNLAILLRANVAVELQRTPTDTPEPIVLSDYDG